MRPLNRITLFSKHLLALLLLLVTLPPIGGCQQSPAGQLLGRWRGKPDTKAARRLREAKKYGDLTSESAGEQLQADGTSTTPPVLKPAKQTDWERYPVGVQLHFVSQTQLQLSLADGSQLRAGTWRVVSTSPTGCRIEVEIDGSPSSETDSLAQSGQLRQFALEMDYEDGQCVGFLLSEVGADPQLGWLYFEPETNESRFSK